MDNWAGGGLINVLLHREQSARQHFYTYIDLYQIVGVHHNLQGVSHCPPGEITVSFHGSSNISNSTLCNWNSCKEGKI